MLRFRATIDGHDKIKAFVKTVDSAAHFSKEYRVVTLTEDTISFFRSSDSVRVESMFELNCYARECFTEFRFEMGDTPNPRLAFDISTQHLSEALGTFVRSDILKFSIKQLDDKPVLRLKNPGGTVQDIAIEFRPDAGPDDYTIPDCVQESLTAVIPESSTITSILTAFKHMENKLVMIIANAQEGSVILKSRTTSDVRSIVKVSHLSVKYKPQVGGDRNYANHEMSVSVNLSVLQSYCKAVPAAGQSIELQIVNNTALRMFVHRQEGLFTMYLCNIDTS